MWNLETDIIPYKLKGSAAPEVSEQLAVLVDWRLTFSKLHFKHALET